MQRGGASQGWGDGQPVGQCVPTDIRTSACATSVPWHPPTLGTRKGPSRPGLSLRIGKSPWQGRLGWDSQACTPTVAVMSDLCAAPEHWECIKGFKKNVKCVNNNFHTDYMLK